MSFYEFLRSAPYVRILIPLMIGFISGYYLKIPVNYLWIFYTLSGLLILSLFLNVGSNCARRWVWGFWLNFVIFFLGFTAYQSCAWKPSFTNEKIIARVTIIENPLEKPNSFGILARIDVYSENGAWKNSSEKVMLTIRKKTNFCRQPAVGDRLLFEGHLDEIKNFGNPYEFDYKSYMNRSGVYYRAFIDSSKWFITGSNPHFNLNILAIKLRNKILNYFRQLELTPSAFAVISALTVGDKSYLDQELKSAYINSGTMHILAVSGMHVALLFWLLQQMTRPLVFWKRGKLVRALIALLVIWLYAMITGLTPSVVRASVMFSFLILGETGKRNVNIYNTLCASALLLLVLNPQILFDVGFQLSYVAVLSIVVFYKDIYDWFYVKNIALKYIWSMVAVSLAAQLLTLPFTLYYFHQFPNYFILSNIVALPLSTLILYGAIFAFFFMPFKFLWFYVGWILKSLVLVMNKALMWVEHLPGAVTSGVGITGLMAVSLIFIVIAFRIFIFNRKAVFIYIILICCIVSSVIVFVKKWKVINSSEMIVLNTSGPLAIILREGTRSYVLTNDSGWNVERLVKPYREALMLKPALKILIGSKTEYKGPDFSFYKGFLLFKGRKLFIWDRKPDFSRPVKVDMLVISKVRRQDAQEIQKYFSASTILIKSDVFIPLATRIKTDFLATKQPCELLNAHGAWSLSLPKKNDK